MSPIPLGLSTHSAHARAGERDRKTERARYQERERGRESQLVKVKVVHFKSPAEILLVLTQYLSKLVKINFSNEALIGLTLGTIPSLLNCIILYNLSPCYFPFPVHLFTFYDEQGNILVSFTVLLRAQKNDLISTSSQLIVDVSISNVIVIAYRPNLFVLKQRWETSGSS